MRRRLAALVFFSCLHAASAIAGEVTSLQWDFLGDLEVFYAVSSKIPRAEVYCTAFNEKNKPIGGGFKLCRWRSGKSTDCCASCLSEHR